MKVVTEDIRRSSGFEVYHDSVDIDGTVRTGARLRVYGNLTVRGDVEDAVVEAGGDVRIAGGFLGMGAGSITCGGSLSAAFVQGQRIEAKGDVEIVRAIISATVFATGDVRTGREGGVIVGGRIHAGGCVESAVLGSKRPVQTRIEVGVDPVLALRIEKLEGEAMELTRKRIGFLKDMAAVATGSAVDCRRESALDMKTAADAMQADIVAAGEEIIEARKHTAINDRAVVKATKACFPPLELSICFSKLAYDKETGPVVFRLLDESIILDTWNME
jgi:uncharacterized protein (DUF342 family)